MKSLSLCIVSLLCAVVVLHQAPLVRGQNTVLEFTTNETSLAVKRTFDVLCEAKDFTIVPDAAGKYFLLVSFYHKIGDKEEPIADYVVDR